MKVILTDSKNERIWEEVQLPAGELSCMQRMCVYPDIHRQTIQGFGGAFTESAAYCYSKLSPKNKEELLKAYFSEEGLGYNLGRTHINSCDFALSNYAADEEEGDENLECFSMEREKKYLFPLIHDAEKVRNSAVKLLLSPWSPPAYMKTNGDMNHGGALKKKYYGRWAKYMVRFAEEMRKEGFTVNWISVQNEPDAVQTWDSCKYTADEEAEFAGKYLGPELNKEQLEDVKILVWDHNKEHAFERTREILKNKEAERYISGIAVHWYTGDHFENLALIREKFPEKEIFFTEGCVEYSRFSESNEVQKAEMYAHDMIGNFKNGVCAHIDWNLLLDAQGGPNHVGNYCDAPIMCTDNFEGIHKNLSYYYIGHFSRYIKPGARVVPVSSYCQELESVAFLNPDGEKAVIVLNRTEKEREINVGEYGKGTAYTVPAHAIATFLWQ